MNIVENILETPWKLKNELIMLALKFPIHIYLAVFGIKIGKKSKFYGFPKIFRFRGSTVEIGDRFEDRNFWSSSPLGINHPTIICTWSQNAVIKIGKNVGISGGSIVASKKIEIGDGTLIGANSTIIDTDFHPIKSSNRRYEKENIKSSPVKIGRNVFIGMNSIILKGVTIPDNAVVPAGSVIRKWE